jgi:dihydrolipoamide dehydrogenase
MAKRFVIIGGGPAGNTAATHAARLGAEVVMIEKDVVGGAAHLWDCIPSKAMIATGGTLARMGKASGMGLREVSAALDLEVVSSRIQAIESRLERSTVDLLSSQGVRLMHGTGRLVGPRQVVADTAEAR